MITRSSIAVIVMTGIVALGLAGGCKNDSDAPRIKQLQGRVVSVNPETGVLKGIFYIKKQQKDMELTGTLAPDAEILINGVTASLQDLRPDDSVTVTGWQQKSGDNDVNVVAKKIEVNRLTDSRPASAPAGAESTGK